MSFKQYQIIETGELVYTWEELPHQLGELIVDYHGVKPCILYSIAFNKARAYVRQQMHGNGIQLISIYSFNTDYMIDKD